MAAPAANTQQRLEALVPHCNEATKKIVACQNFLGLKVRPTRGDFIVDLTSSDHPKVIEVRGIVEKNLFKGGIVGGIAGFVLSLPAKSIKAAFWGTICGAFCGAVCGVGVTYVLPQPAVEEYLENETGVLLRQQCFQEKAETLAKLDDRFEDFLCPITLSFIQDPVQIPGDPPNRYYERGALLSSIEQWHGVRDAEVQKRDNGQAYNEALVAELENPHVKNCPFKRVRLSVAEVKNLPFALDYFPSFRDCASEVLGNQNALYEETIQTLQQELQSVRVNVLSSLIRSVWVARHNGRISRADAVQLTDHLDRMMG